MSDNVKLLLGLLVFMLILGLVGKMELDVEKQRGNVQRCATWGIDC